MDAVCPLTFNSHANKMTTMKIQINKVSRLGKFADRIATGKRRFVTVPRESLADVALIVQAKYKGSFTWFGLGKAVCMRDKGGEMIPREKPYKWGGDADLANKIFGESYGVDWISD